MFIQRWNDAHGIQEDLQHNPYHLNLVVTTHSPDAWDVLTIEPFEGETYTLTDWRNVVGDITPHQDSATRVVTFQWGTQNPGQAIYYLDEVPCAYATMDILVEAPGKESTTYTLMIYRIYDPDN